jgi:hypothetical protein
VKNIEYLALSRTTYVDFCPTSTFQNQVVASLARTVSENHHAQASALELTLVAQAGSVKAFAQ